MDKICYVFLIIRGNQTIRSNSLQESILERLYPMERFIGL